MGDTTAATAASAAKRRAATHCINGHPFTAANTYIRPGNGRRQCRTCVRDARARYNASIRRLRIVARTARRVGVRAW